ncbi:GlxA family transcriptional regulator [Mesorhizobium sp. M4B.F.Ca.ET.190.01.1.1]|uniref:GlxA family transcriptional regulator n=1 Tax=unclassified Mesorhizobium TaxID=325217 RepID=UPI0010920291|nr:MULTISPECIES: GlxA family transcriptional regulator [unclassified Mesorhizobium]TGR10537.1 GlxA family transcriptional regulator [Mesorhizobium sp. M4B.F.Ca.ET.200.01.1.1]TGS19627.1 GlxA family transcriptional regulator [Mesorhizobium sp. M4B.F.Ca.ET.190.01.1.1]TGT32407.1 GlxA family transcriptional regulator [Mesorhizobium sp. M4B.F.Ca.ET.172.01.1.1]
MKRDNVKLSVGFILTPRFTLSALANFIDVLRLASDDGDRSQRVNCDWKILSDNMASVQSSCGVSVQPDMRLGDPSKFQYVVVVGGLLKYSKEISTEYRDFLYDAVSKRVPLIGICTGVFLLHKLRLMDGYRCCVSWYHHHDFIEQCDGLLPVSDQIFVVDRDRLTCPGGNSSAHLASWLVQKHVGESHARKSLRHLMIDQIERPEKPQPGLPLERFSSNSAVQKAMLFMQQNLDRSITVSDTAKHVEMSRRQMERQFKHEFGLTPSEILRQIRLDHAELLLLTTDKSLTDIAAEAGFADDSHFIRIFRQHWRTTPNVFRAEHSRNAANVRAH